MLRCLLVDLEAGRRGFVITGQERFLEPWRHAQTAFFAEAATLERLVAADPDQARRVGQIAQATRSYLRDYSVPLVATARRDPAAARIVAATDAERRRIERDLHDGTQQRLVSLLLELRAAEAAVPSELAGARDGLDRVADGLTGALDELRELSHGIHPAILSEGGLGPALKALARRAALPVELEVEVPGRLPEPVEVAAYYVVSEALANAAKHAQASLVRVGAEARDGRLRLTVRDDGVGGAAPGGGSGLVGLADRVEALGGTLTIHSPTGQGTRLEIDLLVARSVPPSG